ncbi:MAG: hypothetical protein WC384_19620 [Prolixibacteraceae bacterium]|jgi:hypothetical protein
MDYTKKFRYLDVRKFFETHSPGNPNSFSNSRRVALKQMSTLMIGISPGISVIEKALNFSFTIQQQSNGLVFFYQENPAWEILPELFDGHPKVVFEESAEVINLELRNAFYPATRIRADFKAIISRKPSGWEMEIVFPQFRANKNLSFIDWLKGNSRVSGLILENLNFPLDRNDRLDICGPVQLLIDHHWQIQLIPEGNAQLKLFGEVEQFTSLKLSLYKLNTLDKPINSEFQKATCVELQQAQGMLQSLESLKFSGKQIFSIEKYPFNYTRLVLLNSAGKIQKSLWAGNETESEANVNFMLQTNGENKLGLFNSRFYKEYNAVGSPFIYLADLGGSPQWIGAGGAAFALQGSANQRFVLAGNGKKVESIDCKALLVASRIHVQGGQSVPVAYKNASEVAIWPQDPVKVKPKTVKAGQVLDTGKILEVAPEDDRKANWIYVNQEPLKVKFKIDKPIMFNVIRPEDFINLQFEFVNFALEDNLLKIDDKKEPSFLIVHFPSQHTREEVMRDINSPTIISFGRQSKNTSIVPNLHAPVKFMRAGSSRLVYRVPSEYGPIPVTLDNLLDWKNFDIQVNYRARWFNQVSGISLIKSQLQASSMVFSRKPSPGEIQMNAPKVSYQARTIQAVDSKRTAVTSLQKPKSVQEIRVILATTPKGSGVMALSDEQFNTLLAKPLVETVNVVDLKGQMKRLLIMNEPSKYETMIEAPTYFQISPNQFSGFQHLTDLRDAAGKYDPSEAGVVETSDETPELKPAQMNRQAAKKAMQINTATAKIRASNIDYYRNVVIGTTASPRYNGIVSSALIRMPVVMALPKGSLFELWHTRMGVKLASGEIDEDALNQLKTVRVLWSEFADEKYSKTAEISEIDDYFYSLPNPQHAHQIVHLTSNYTDLTLEGTRKKKYTPHAVKADLLMLSALGSWIDFKLNIPEDVELLSVKAWLQRATMGRDHYIKIVERGTLFPFGHKALLITIAERRIRTINNVNTAVLIQREFIIVKQPELYYGKQAGSNDFIPFPFQRVELKDMESEVFSETVLEGSKTIGKELFMPDGSGRPRYFRIDVDDASGKTVRMEVPLNWISAIVESGDGLIKHYNDSNWDYFTSNAPAKPLAYARSLIPGDTTFETAGIIFKARSFTNADTGGTYYPEILESSVYIRQMEELTGKRKPVTIKLIDDNNMSMVFAEIIDEEKQSLVFDDTEKGGGFLAPNMNINGLSKLTGLVGNKIEDLEKVVLNIQDVFSMADKLMPKLFGAIRFIDLLVDKVDVTPAMNQIKSAVENIRSQIEDLEQEILSVLARIDNEVKKLDKLIEVIGSLLNETDIVGALQDIQKLSVAFSNYGISIEGDAVDALNATVLVGKEIQDKGIELDSVVGFVGNAQGLKNKLQSAGIQLTPEISGAVDQMLKVVKALDQKGFGDLEILGIIGGLGLANQLFDIQGLIKNLASQVADKVLQAIPEIPNVKFQIKGNEVVVEYHWKPKTKNEYSAAGIFRIANSNKSMSQVEVSIDSVMTKSLDLNNAPKFDVNASIKEFSITIADTIQLNFSKIAFKAGMSSKPDVDVKFQPVPIRLVGSLSFVNSLQQVVKSDQFSSGPFINITGTGIEAGFNFALPNIEVGIFALSNMMLGTKLILPLNRDPLRLGFNFCTRENPFALMVSCFGGGGFFAIETTMNGLTRLDAAFEFGAGISLNVGVASGSVSVKGGIYYSMVVSDSGDESYTLSAYIRMTGRLSIIGLIRVTLEFYLELSYQTGSEKGEVDGIKLYQGSRLVGSATLTVKVEVLFFSKSVSVTVSRTLSGNDADPTFAQTYRQDHWLEYCNAFAS